jgi:hypothetical protein
MTVPDKRTGGVYYVHRRTFKTQTTFPLYTWDDDTRAITVSRLIRGCLARAAYRQARRKVILVQSRWRARLGRRHGAAMLAIARAAKAAAMDAALAALNPNGGTGRVGTATGGRRRLASRQGGGGGSRPGSSSTGKRLVQSRGEGQENSLAASLSEFNQDGSLQGTTPDSPAAAAAEPPSGWQAFEDDEGTPYFHNPSTGETRWDRPSAADEGGGVDAHEGGTTRAAAQQLDASVAEAAAASAAAAAAWPDTLCTVCGKAPSARMCVGCGDAFKWGRPSAQCLPCYISVHARPGFDNHAWVIPDHVVQAGTGTIVCFRCSDAAATHQCHVCLQPGGTPGMFCSGCFRTTHACVECDAAVGEFQVG